jgi:hypothetical protein
VLRGSLTLFLLIGWFCGGISCAQTYLLNDVHTVALPSSGVPVEHDVQISAPGNYDVQLTDLGSLFTPPAPLASVALAVTSNDAIVGTPLVGAGVLHFTASAAGTYRLHVVGSPGSNPGSGPIGIQVSSASGGAPIFSSSDDLAPPAQSLPNAVAVLQDTFTVSTSGSYQVSLSDLNLPQSLGVLSLLIVQQGASTPVLILPATGAPNPLQATVSLQSGSIYQIFAVGQAGVDGTAGLFSATVVAAGGSTPAYSKTVAVGGTTLLGNPVLSTGSVKLSLADLAFPVTLTQLGAALVLNGQSVAELAMPGSQTVAASAGTYQVFGVATAASSGGAYTVDLQPNGGASLFSAAEGVSAAGGTISVYSFDTIIATAGNYTAAINDIQIPSPLSIADLAVVQAGVLLGTQSQRPGSFLVKASAGPLTLIAFAQPGSGGSLLDVDLTASDGSLTFDQPEAVGAAFASNSVSITTPGAYSVSVNDLGFPASFADLAVVVTHGGSAVGSIFGGGAFNFQAAAAGSYFVNILATPTGTDQAGTYALEVATAPPAPTVMLSADATRVGAGGTVHLIWTTQNATSCTGSGGGWTGTYTGAQAASDSATSPTISATTTFTLTCQGPGGSTPASVTVQLQAKSGGGGLGVWSVLLLSLCAVARVTRVARRDKSAQ